MRNPATTDASALHDAEIAMFFTVFLAPVNFQMHG
jgi:hypothetical protein